MIVVDPIPVHRVASQFACLNLHLLLFSWAYACIFKVLFSSTKSTFEWLAAIELTRLFRAFFWLSHSTLALWLMGFKTTIIIGGTAESKKKVLSLNLFEHKHTYLFLGGKYVTNLHTTHDSWESFSREKLYANREEEKNYGEPNRNGWDHRRHRSRCCLSCMMSIGFDHKIPIKITFRHTSSNCTLNDYHFICVTEIFFM